MPTQDDLKSLEDRIKNIEATLGHILKNAGHNVEVYEELYTSPDYSRLLDFDAVGKVINLPEDHLITMFVVIGKAIKENQPRGGQLQMEDVVITNHF